MDKSELIKKMAGEIGELTAEKNAVYGDSFARAGHILKELYPNGVKPDQYGDMLAVARIVDKLFRIAARKDAFGESPFKDIAGYGLIGTVTDAPKKEVATGPAINWEPRNGADGYTASVGNYTLYAVPWGKSFRASIYVKGHTGEPIDVVENLHDQQHAFEHAEAMFGRVCKK